MKHIVFFIPLAIFFLCCSSSTKEPNKWILLNDSITTLIRRGQMQGDKNLLHRALVMSDSLLLVDTSKTSMIKYHEFRSVIYALLNDSLKATEEGEKAYLLLDVNNVTRTSYFAAKYHRIGMVDSADFYFNKSMVAYNELLKTKDDLYLSNVIGKAILLDEIKGRKETIKFLEEEKNKYPEDKELKEFVKEVYEYGPLGEYHFYEEY